MSLNDLKNLTFGMVLDMMTEAANDSVEYPKIATQEDINSILRG